MSENNFNLVCSPMKFDNLNGKSNVIGFVCKQKDVENFKTLKNISNQISQQVGILSDPSLQQGIVSNLLPQVGILSVPSYIEIKSIGQRQRIQKKIKTCACDNAVLGQCHNNGDAVLNKNTVDGWNQQFQLLNITNRISWLGKGNCDSMPPEIEAKLQSQMETPGECVCDSGAMGICNNYNDKNQTTIDAWNTHFKSVGEKRIAWLGSLVGNCNNIGK